jgi:hypothetical protein
MRALRHLTPAGLLILAGAWMLSDGVHFLMYSFDPQTGREAACYTQLELWVGAIRPGWLRMIELMGAVTLIPLGMLKLFEFFRARRQDARRYQ